MTRQAAGSQPQPQQLRSNTLLAVRCQSFCLTPACHLLACLARLPVHHCSLKSWLGADTYAKTFAAAGLAGTLSWALLYPLETVRSRVTLSSSYR